MAGIIEKAQSGKITPQSVRSQMKIPPDKANAYERVVAAGKNILYSEQMQPQIDEMIKAPGSIGEKIGQGVVALMAILIDKSNGTMPPDLIIPAATELVAEVGDFLKQSGMDVSDQDVGEGMSSMIEIIMEKSGITPDQLPGLLKGDGQGAPAPDPAAPAEAPPAPADQPQGV